MGRAGAGRQFQQFHQQQPAVRHIHPQDVRRVRRQIERPAPGTRMCIDQGLHDRWQRRPLLWREIGKSKQRARVHQTVLHAGTFHRDLAFRA